MAFRLIANTCEGGPCPRFWQDVVTGDVTVQGYVTNEAPEAAPPGEGFLRIPAADWRTLISQVTAGS
jgi:hypothetical protein